MCYFHNSWHTIEKKHNTIVGEYGAKISGGQAQRIGIARALYFSPSILILDEPTSSLDSETENKILNTLINLKKNITIIIVSHNKNALKIANRIYEISDKNFVELKQY